MSYALPNRLVIATHNNGKLQEFRQLLGSCVPEIVSAGELGLPSPEETGVTFVENAVLKAKAASEATGCFALADDSGLCVTALGGDPGLYSARWAQPDAAAGIARVQKALGAATDRSASFICVLALYWPDGYTEIIERRVNGTIARDCRGVGGHGYDPVFIPTGDTRSFAEMSEAEKNAISHRGQATQALVARFLGR